MTMKKALLFIFWFCVTLGCKAQTDTEFWFAAPDLDVNHAEQPIRFCVVSYEEAATVVFEQPANAFYSPQTFRGSLLPRDRAHVSCIGRHILYG